LSVLCSWQKFYHATNRANIARAVECGQLKREMLMSDKPDGKGQERTAMGLLPRIAIGAMVGVPAFGLIGIFIGCVVLWPDSNLCGLFPILLAIPLGAPIGACIGAFTMLIPRRKH
jgi:hypothetical protein